MAFQKEKENKIKTAAALSYSPDENMAPKVVASGKGVIAESILKAAEEANVPVYEDEHLAEALSSIKLGSEIPTELYEVVAELLAFISRLDERYTWEDD